MVELLKRQEEEEKLKEKTRAISIKEAGIFSVSDGFGLRNISPYALALGAGNTAIGLLSSLPSLIGNFSQLFTSRLMRKYSRKKIVVVSVFLQAFMWLILLIPGLLFFIFHFSSKVSSSSLVVIYTLLVLFGAIAGPAWQSWMKDISPQRSGHFFGVRNKVAGTVSLVSMLVAGFILDYFKQTKIFMAFVILFSFSFVARSISGYLFTKEYDPEFKYEPASYFSFVQFLKKMTGNNFGRFVIFISLISFATAIASPFFVVYMIKDRGMSYSAYFATTIANTLVTLLVMPFWGKFADSHGNVKIMKILGFFICLTPMLWVFSIFFDGFILLLYLVLIEAFAGFVWAGFNLAAGNFIYDAVTRQRMAICTSYFNILNGFGVFLGASLGGILASFNLHFLAYGMIFVFFISGLARLAIYLIFARRIHEVREVESFDGVKHIKKKLSIFNPLRFLEYFSSRELKSVGVD